MKAWTGGSLAATRGQGCRDVCQRGRCVRNFENEKGNEKGNYWNIVRSSRYVKDWEIGERYSKNNILMLS